jgi:glycosyltransferase involved in cell wall biosynthesis
MAPLEAMACGLPVIASMSGGLVDTLRDQFNALVHEPNDPRSMAACIQRLQADPVLLARLRQGALTHARERNWQATMDQLIEFYDLAVRVHSQRGNVRRRTPFELEQV